MMYVVTFEDCAGGYESFTVSSSCMEIAVMDAKEKANEKHGYTNGDFYYDCDVLSIIRV